MEKKTIFDLPKITLPFYNLETNITSDREFINTINLETFLRDKMKALVEDHEDDACVYCTHPQPCHKLSVINFIKELLGE